MRKVLSVLAVATLVAAMGGTAFAKTETVKGQLVDQECYQREKKVDADSACAVSTGTGQGAAIIVGATQKRRREVRCCA